MPAIPIDMRPNQHFSREGKLLQYGTLYTYNPRETLPKHTRAARLFVGFNVEDVPTWTLADLVAIVRRVRAKQEIVPGSHGHVKTVPPDATFYATHGLYTHKSGKRKGETVEEDGAQIVILSIFGESEAQFDANILKLADVIVVEFEQAEVIVEFQVSGIVQDTISVTP